MLKSTNVKKNDTVSIAWGTLNEDQWKWGGMGGGGLLV